MLSCQKACFSLPPDTHYLNCAYMSPLSQRVEQAGVAGIHRKATPGDIVPADFFAGCDRVRDLFARLVNVREANRIAVIPAASYGLAIAARNTAVHRGQNIVILEHQFPSNVYVWRRVAAETRATVRVVSPPDAGTERGQGWNDAIVGAIDKDTAVVSLAHVHWADGTRFDLERIGARAREVGAAFVVDGTQSVGAMPFDVGRIQPDALVCAGYKWLTGPYSIGVAYFGPRYDDGTPLEETWIAREGSENFGGLVQYRDGYRPGAARYDVGEASNFILVPMLAAALEQLLDWGVAEIQAYCGGLTADLVVELGERGFKVAGDEWRAGHLVGLRVPPAMDLADLQERLRKRRVLVSARGDAVRLSPHVYNDRADIDALRAILCS